MEDKFDLKYTFSENLFIENKNDKLLLFFIRLLKDNFIYSDFVKSSHSNMIRRFFHNRNMKLYNFIHNLLIANNSIPKDHVKLYRSVDYKLNKILKEYNYECYDDLLENQSYTMKQKEIEQYKKYFQ